MMLLEMKRYIDDQREVSLSTIAHHFNLPEAVAEEMLECWVLKQKISKHLSACGTTTVSKLCGGCSSNCSAVAIPKVAAPRAVIYQSLS